MLAFPAGDGLRRLVYRTQRWDTDFAAHVRRLRERKPVIITGDFNCAHKVLEIVRTIGVQHHSLLPVLMACCAAQDPRRRCGRPCNICPDAGD